MKLLVDFVRHSNLIEGIDRDPLPHEVKAHQDFIAYGTVYSLKSIEMFVEVILGKTGMLRQHKGMDVMVGNYVAPGGGGGVVTDLVNLINKAGEDTRPRRLVAFDYHWQYLHLHPFMDGNGRSARALWLKIMGLGSLEQRSFMHEYYYQSLMWQDINRK